MLTNDEDVIYRLLVQSVTDFAISMLTLEGNVSNWIAGAERVEGYKADEIVGRHFSAFYTEADRADDLPGRALDAALRQGRFEAEGWRVRRDGSRFWGHVVLQTVEDGSGTTVGFAMILRDMTEQKEREAREAELERNFRLLVQGITDYAIYLLSPEGIVSNWNAGAERAKGYHADEIVGQHFSRFYTPEDRKTGLPEKALATARNNGRFEGEGWRVRKDGSRFWAHVVIDPVRNEEGELIGFAKITRDVTEKKSIQDQVSHLAHHDALTALLNRASFRDAVDQILANPRNCSLLYLDLDRFKPVNDTLGHLAGDKVLQAVAERIAGQLRKTDVGGRLGGDEFAVLLVGCEDKAAAMGAATRLIREIEKPIPIDHFSVSVGASVGIAFTGSGSVSTERLLRNADLALYAAKKEQRGTYRCYEIGMEDVLLKRKALEDDLKLALHQNEFFLQYQPIFDVSRDSVRGYEALIRWQSPTRGRVAPIDFIPFAEEHGFIQEIGDWVLYTACKEASKWSEDLYISINVSPAQFHSPHLVEKIATVLETTGLSPARLELEITETAMMSDIAGAKTLLDKLRAMGIQIALDDFGTGFSSLSFLRSLPFTRIKIDKSFVQDLGKSEESLAIVRAVTGLSNSLGLATTAEGVETEEQRHILKLEGCHNLQGYLLGRPAAAPKQEDADAGGSTGDLPSKAA